VFATENARPEWVIPGVAKVVYKAKVDTSDGQSVFATLRQAQARA
jgi:hypothetical protein